VGTMWPAWFTDCANLLRLLLARDTDDKSGVKDLTWLRGVHAKWVTPQISRIAILRQEEGLDVQAGFVLERWSDAIERLEEMMPGPLS
jgi:hypothetical protein